MRILPFATIFACCLFASFCVAQAGRLDIGSSRFSELRATGTGIVSSVIDDRTLVLRDGRIVRLSGLDSPRDAFGEPSETAVQAAAFLKDTLSGKTVTLYQTKGSQAGRTNRMGHQLAHLERQEDALWIQGALLSKGLSRVRTSERNPEMAAAMYALEDEARKAGLGIWSNPTFAILSPEQAGKAIGSWAIVEGRVRSVGNVGNQVYLNFGPDWRTDFTVSISGTARRAFLAQGIDPLRLNGQLIRVRGWLESWNGPHIKADHPGQVEFRAEDPAEKAVRTGEAGTGSVPSMKSLSFSAPEPP